MSQLIVDIGNTNTKTVECANGQFSEVSVFSSDTELKKYLHKKRNITTIISSVRQQDFTQEIAELFDVPPIVLKHTTPLPVVSLYATPETLGNDRIANAVAAAHYKPNQNNIIIDAGTCLKIDFINKKNEYIGGSISPGLAMRYKALHTFTDNLPLYPPMTTSKITGNTTKSSIVSGVYQGMLQEIRGVVGEYEKQYPQLNLFLTGGDLSFFYNVEISQKNSIFADSKLTLRGLKTILDYNV